MADPRTRRRLGPIVLAVGFGLFFAYDLWEAISNAVSIGQLYTALGLDTADVPWWLLVVGIAVPPVAFGLALLLGRGRTLPGKALILAVGLAVVAALSLGVVALEGVLRLGLYA